MLLEIILIAAWTWFVLWVGKKCIERQQKIIDKAAK
jgi:hypothetical protein